MSERITHAAELRRKAMCRSALLRPVRARAARAASPERKWLSPSTGDLQSGETLRHGVPERADENEPETNGPNVSTQPTLFVDVSRQTLPAIPQAFGTRTLIGVGGSEQPPAESFTPEYAPALPDRPFLAWLKEAAAQQEQFEPQVAQPIRLPTLVADSSVSLALELSPREEMPAIPRPQPLAARVQPVITHEAEQSVCAWVGCVCALGLVALTLWPFEVNAVAYGGFERYSQIELALSPLQAPVVAVHVVPGQRVQAGSPLISLDASALEHELAELNVTLDQSLVAQVQAQAAQGELDPPPSAAGDTEAEAVASLRERRIALQRKLHSRQVVAAKSGIVTQVVPALGEVVESGAPVVRIVPDNPSLRLVAHFEERDAKDLRATKQAILTLGADEMVVGAQVVRVHGAEVELKLDDAASVPELDRRLRSDSKLSVEFERERTLLALAAERLRSLRRR